MAASFHSFPSPRSIFSSSFCAILFGWRREGNIMMHITISISLILVKRYLNV